MPSSALVPVRWKNGVLEVVDQTVLPAKLVYVRLRTIEQVCAAIKSMKVRGAPLIGVVGAYGLVLGAKKVRTKDPAEASKQLRKLADSLIATRPTAVNLPWAVERVLKASAKNDGSLEETLLREANSILEEELDAAHKIGRFGASLIDDEDTVLTHCNAGTLATAGYGTALALVRAAVEQGKRVSVIATETRPLLQGARLTAFELSKDHIPVKLICDSAAAEIMSTGVVDKVVVGADRILRTGHVTNKIGTLPIALAAKFYGVPFYVAAPTSTVDISRDVSQVVIEQRDQREVLLMAGKRIAPRNVEALNPAFDITPPELVTGIITERGVVRQPLEENIRSQMSSQIPIKSLRELRGLASGMSAQGLGDEGLER
jgi:methylthioribose-1-phosphate isomerase